MIKICCVKLRIKSPRENLTMTFEKNGFKHTGKLMYLLKYPFTYEMYILYKKLMWSRILYQITFLNIKILPHSTRHSSPATPKDHSTPCAGRRCTGCQPHRCPAPSTAPQGWGDPALRTPSRSWRTFLKASPMQPADPGKRPPLSWWLFLSSWVLGKVWHPWQQHVPAARAVESSCSGDSHF